MTFNYKIILPVLICLSMIPLRVYAQGSYRIKTEAHLMNSIVVDVESGIDVLFTEDVSSYVVRSSDEGGKKPALIRISGAAVEAMVDVEFAQASGQGDNGSESITISEFNVLNGRAGSSVTIMPFVGDGTILLTVGGTISGVSANDVFYTGINVININYL